MLAELIRSFHEAKHCDAPEIVVWGHRLPAARVPPRRRPRPGPPVPTRRYDEPVAISVGVGEDLSLRALAEMVATSSATPVP